MNSFLIKRYCDRIIYGDIIFCILFMDIVFYTLYADHISWKTNIDVVVRR